MFVIVSSVFRLKNYKEMKISLGDVAVKFRWDVVVEMEKSSFGVLIEYNFVSSCKSLYHFSGIH